MKQHRFWAWGAVICMVMVLITGYRHKVKEKERMDSYAYLFKLACFIGGALFGSVGIKLLSSKDAKKAYTHITAAGLRMKDSAMKTVATVQEKRRGYPGLRQGY
mgnify:CR=1 FL=1